MTKPLNCPVCGYQEVETDVCPKCDTDLTILRTLAQIIPTPSAPTPNPWRMVSIILILLLGIVIVIGLNTLLSPSPSITGVSPIVPVPPPPNPKPPKPANSSSSDSQETIAFDYTIRSGDSLSRVAQNIYGDERLWTMILDANPSLKGRENLLKIGETIIIPIPKDKIRELE